jgi:hypothetical protein
MSTGQKSIARTQHCAHSIAQGVFDSLCSMQVDLLKQLMTFNPSGRIDAVAALRHSFFSQPAGSQSDDGT